MFPLILQNKFVTLYTIWIFVALAIIAGTYALIKLSLNNGLKLQFLSSNSVKLILATFLGARLVGVLLDFYFYFYEISLNSFFRFFFIWDRNFNLWGGAFGFFLTLYFICRKTDQDFWKWLDTVVPAGIIAFAVGHIGAFFGGINYGSPTSLPWGVNFASPLIKYTVPIHPTQIYAFLYSICLILGLWGISNYKNFPEKTGILGLTGIFAYSFLRFLEEFVRGDDSMLIFGIRIGKFLIPMFFIFTGVIIYLRYNDVQIRKLKK
jgi:phosphatidylglycerol---prolipoprotein diacylglyceryl transferase